MKPFVYRLLAPRATFAIDMTPEEQTTMAEHATYWRGLMEEGKALLFGPVNDPTGSYGLAIVLAEDLAAAEAVRDADPAVTAPHGLRVEITPMFRVVTPEGTYEGE